MRRLLRSSASTMLFMLAAIAACRESAELTAEDSAAIRNLDSVYVDAWLRDDTAAVMATLAPDAVLMPAGFRPLQGDSAIRRPPGNSARYGVVPPKIPTIASSNVSA